MISMSLETLAKTLLTAAFFVGIMLVDEMMNLLIKPDSPLWPWPVSWGIRIKGRFYGQPQLVPMWTAWETVFVILAVCFLLGVWL